jgi:hypothetical protein
MALKYKPFLRSLYIVNMNLCDFDLLAKSNCSEERSGLFYDVNVVFARKDLLLPRSNSKIFPNLYLTGQIMSFEKRTERLKSL